MYIKPDRGKSRDRMTTSYGPRKSNITFLHGLREGNQSEATGIKMRIKKN